MSYMLIHIVLLIFLSFFSIYMTGMFVFFTIMVGTTLAAGFYKTKSTNSPSKQEMVFFVSIFTLIAFVVQYLSSNHFKVNQPNELMLIFMPFFIWHPFRFITK